MKVTVDQDVCIGCGMCASSCPNVFTIEGDKAHANSTVAAGDEDSVKQTASDCPVSAIKVE